MKTLVSAAAAAVLGASAAAAQDARTVEHDGHEWTFEAGDGGDVRVETHLGREAIYVTRAAAVRADLDLADVVIEYDYASTQPSGFIGVNFRIDANAPNLEQFYTRPHQSGHPDATQYMVMINGVATWQLHAGPNEATAVDLPAEEWIKVRIVAVGDRADFYVGDMETPLLHAPNLRFDGGHGGVGLFASDRPWMTDTGAYFSDIAIRPAGDGDRIVGTPRDADPLPEGLLRSFDVSSPFAEADVASQTALGAHDLSERTWATLDVEDNGVANLARTTAIEDGANTVFVRTTIVADEATDRLMMFGYSDRVRLYVNGEQIYFGNAQWRSRDHRFLGTVALADGAVLHLDEGENEVVAAVSEMFGGWGFMAQIENQDGLTID